MGGHLEQYIARMERARGADILAKCGYTHLDFGGQRIAFDRQIEEPVPMTNKPTATEGPVNDPGLSFEIEGPDGDDFVWLETNNVVLNLGRSADVAEKFSQWLGSVDYQENGVVRIKRMR